MYPTGLLLAPSTMKFADLYPGTREAQAGAAPATQAASGKEVVAPVNAPFMFWIGIIVLLVALRLVYEYIPAR